ncbi:MAG: hypothetical protein HY822_02535 [Acidobacteria bacterium]|nr:hypothetical protein [Acidobacteriota bacterium]
MACPYFRPLARLAPESWIDPPRLPLVDPFEGLCEAATEAWTPDGETLRECCSFGYARGRCARFPANAPCDAVRFTAAGDGEIRYVLEKDCAPVGHGPREAATGRLAAQAEAFAGAWNRRPRKEGEPCSKAVRSANR